MFKISKKILISTLLLIILCMIFSINKTSFATDDDQDIQNNVITESPSKPISTLSTSSGASVTSINSYAEANLQLNNILNIILISLGVLLILFAIAILIRLKSLK